MKCIKRMVPLLLIVFLLAGPVTALAAGSTTVDFSRTGSISVTLKTGDAAVAKAELTVYRVADIQSKNNNLSFVFTDAYAGFGGDADKLLVSADVERLTAYTKEHGIVGTSGKTDASGFVQFGDLKLGLYLLVQTGSVDGVSDCPPFLVMLPTEENGAWSYDIDATPKTDVERLTDISVKKVWNDGEADSRPEHVTVQLLRDGAGVDTVTLNAQNGWSHTWEDLPESDSYEIKEQDVPKGYTATYERSGYVFTVTNSSTLIQTGQIVWPIPVLAVCGLVLFAAGVLLYRRKKEDA